MFKKAERKQSKLRLAISGASGSGKTIGALKIATGLGGSIAVLDSENGSASLYADEYNFDVVNLSPPYTPERYIEVIKAAEKAGYDTLIIDSTTHEWSGVGGCLELVDDVAKSRFRGNTWSAWSEITPRHRAFVDAILQSKMHIITTMRSKTETAQVEVNGRKQVQKLGMKAEQRDGIEYEFTVVLDIVHDGHYANASKDRTQLFSGDPKRITVETGEQLSAWLNSGKAELLEQIQPEPQQPVEQKKVYQPKIDIIALLRSITNALNIDALKDAASKVPSEGLSDKDKESIKRAYAKRKQELSPVNIDSILMLMETANTKEQLDKTWVEKVDGFNGSAGLLTEAQPQTLVEAYNKCLDEITLNQEAA